MLNHWLRLLVLAATLLKLWESPASATSVPPMGLRALTVGADAIVIATVANLHSQWIDDRHSGIETLVTLTDVVSLSGGSPAAETIRFSGGTVDGIREEFVGVPRFTPGERVVLFLRQEHSVSPIVGFSQGCFRVVDSASGPVVLTAEGRPLNAIDDDHIDAGSAAGESGEAPAGAMPLGDFLESVQRMLSSTRQAHP